MSTPQQVIYNVFTIFSKIFKLFSLIVLFKEFRALVYLSGPIIVDDCLKISNLTGYPVPSPYRGLRSLTPALLSSPRKFSLLQPLLGGSQNRQDWWAQLSIQEFNWDFEFGFQETKASLANVDCQTNCISKIMPFLCTVKFNTLSFNFFFLKVFFKLIFFRNWKSLVSTVILLPRPVYWTHMWISRLMLIQSKYSVFS